MSDFNDTLSANVSNGVVVAIGLSEAHPDWIMCPPGVRVGDSYANGIFTPKRQPRVWTRAEFLARVKLYAPGAWETFLNAVDSGNKTARTIYEEGWVIRTEVQEDHPDTVQMLGALSAVLGAPTAEQIDLILHAP